jgi:hypothetical protein
VVRGAEHDRHEHRDDDQHEHRAELRKEAFTTALYVAVCLLATLLAIPPIREPHVLGTIWGVTVGLALAHWFAFRLSARLVGAGRIRRQDLDSAGAQLGGAAVVALLTSVVVMILPADAEVRAAELTLSGFIGLVGYAVARSGGSGRIRALIYAACVLAGALAIATAKNALAGH